MPATLSLAFNKHTTRDGFIIQLIRFLPLLILLVGALLAFLIVLIHSSFSSPSRSSLPSYQFLLALSLSSARLSLHSTPSLSPFPPAPCSSLLTILPSAFPDCVPLILEGPTRKPRHASVFSTHSDTQAVPAFQCIRCLEAFFRHARFLNAPTRCLPLLKRGPKTISKH